MSDPALCHYSALGLTKEATLSDIKKAFRKLALEFHPDKVQGEQAKEASSKKFQRVNEAYGILSDQDKRQEYDDKVKLAELRRRAKGEANISAPRTPTSTQHYDVRYAEPRPDTFSRAKSTSRTTSTSTSSKFYTQYPPSASRSYEEDIYTARQYEDMSRTARRQPSYDEKPSKREEERERERRQTERADARAAERAAERKEKERRVDKDSKKAKEKQRKREGEEKRSHREYHDDEDVIRTSKVDKKKSSSSSKKHDDRDRREKSLPREHDSVITEKSRASEARAMMAAADYINASRSKANPLSRSATFQPDYRYASPPVAVPTPPVAQEAPFPPPNISVELDSDEDLPRRSAAKPSIRRSSETPRTRERSSHKKSGSGSREYETPPVVIPTHARVVPQFAKVSSTPPKVPDSPPRQQKLPRSQTMREPEFSRVPPQPPLNRSSTYHYGEYDTRAPEPRGRDRSRYQAQILSEDDSDSDDRRFESRRDRRHRTHSPDFVEGYAAPPPRSSSTRYTINKDGRTAEAVYYYPDGASPPSSRKAKYYDYAGRTPEARPSMPPRSGSNYSTSGGGGYIPHKIKTAQSYTREDIQYGQMAYQEAGYGGL